MSPRSADELLLQLDLIEDVLPKVGGKQWQTLYSHSRDDHGELTIWCGLLEPKAVGTAMEEVGWDLMIGDGLPGFSRRWSSSGTTTVYHRFGIAGVRPLVLSRSFHGAFTPYCELDEEFRLYHNLAEDKDRGLLLSFDDSGREIEVARIEEQRVGVRLKHLRQFQAGTGLYVAIYFESVRYSQIPLADVPEDERERERVENLVRWHRIVAKWDVSNEAETASRLLGKVILAPPPRDKAGIWPFSEMGEDEPDVKFIVGIDSNGDPVEFTSNPDQLKNYFGANPEARDYLTPVYFRREVLGKYFAEPDRYRVGDGQLSCLSLWSCRIDNDLDSYVVVFLGDLGRDLPYGERLHWRQFNVPPEGGVSETQFRRGFLAKFADAKTPDLVFRREYENLNDQWQQSQGWSLYLPLAVGDQHLLKAIRLLVTNSQNEFDEQVICLTKLLVDSLNERELEARVGDLGKDVKGIGKLSAFLEATAFPQASSAIRFLKDLQKLRSTGSAHRKGKSYAKIIDKLGVQSSKKADVFRFLLEAANDMLCTLQRHYCGEDKDSRSVASAAGSMERAVDDS